MYEIGKIVATHGINGEVRVINLSDFERFVQGIKVYVPINEKEIELTIENVRLHKGSYLIKFIEYNNINECLFLIKQSLYVKRRAIVGDGYYFDELIGKKAVLEDGSIVGTIVTIRIVPQGHILEIDTGTKKVLIPFIKEFVKDVGDNVVITPIEGLL